MKSFIRIAEVWAPSADGTALELSSGLFPGVPAFEAITRQMIFGRGEGLPGRAWEAGHPVMMRELEGSYFKRAAAARAIDLTCAVACPVFQSGELRCVVVFLLGGAQSALGSVELWRNDSRISPDLSLADGYFGSSQRAADLEALTRDGLLPRGAGAPGLAWQKGETVCIPDISTSRNFLRKDLALALGIGRAMAIPCSAGDAKTWVLTMLSAAATPIALRVEVWRASEVTPDELTRTAGFCEHLGKLATGPDHTHNLAALGPIGKAWRTAVAQAESPLPELGTKADQKALQAASITSVLALPVVEDDEVLEVVALYF